MNHCGIGYWDVLNMPNGMFWELSRNLDRYAAERDLRALSVAQVAPHPEAAQELSKRLVLEVGKPVQTRETLDRKGIEKLRALSGA